MHFTFGYKYLRKDKMHYDIILALYNALYMKALSKPSVTKNT